MDAQKLKELRREVELAQKHGTTPDISAWDLFEVLNIAERAVSPAESVQSIDTPAFRRLLNAAWAHRGNAGGKETTADLIAYIDAKIAIAHAEGRRSALEELHPQWLKEKDRADRAEAAIAAAREEGARDKDGNHVDDLRGLLDEAQEQYEAQNVAFQACSLKLQQTEAALTARQAPDLKQIMVIVEKEFDWTDFMPGHKKAIATIKSRLRTLLSSTAQPLQQEGGKETLANGWPNDFHEVVKGAEDNAYQLGRAAGIEEVAKVFEKNDMHATAADVRALAPQPSDNLQQASTAQIAPAEAPPHYSSAEASAWQSGWESGHEATSTADPYGDRWHSLTCDGTCNPPCKDAPAQATPEGRK